MNMKRKKDLSLTDPFFFMPYANDNLQHYASVKQQLVASRQDLVAEVIKTRTILRSIIQHRKPEN
ncbi:MAG: hypothetical protein EBR30_30760, partial [Cytophagia bacterium]|nr:hypothetical protein [Cytophagia bacterium]NBW39327.1 hypothetical protein [Cytophagia bacterium]